MHDVFAEGIGEATLNDMTKQELVMFCRLQGYKGEVRESWNKDKIVNRDDAVALANELERLAKTPELSAFIGGIGIYAATAAHGPFVHVDTRPWKARW